MLRRLLVGAMIAVAALAGEIPEPSSLYLVSVSFSDFGPSFYYRLIELDPSGAGSLVRYTRVASFNVYCPRRIVQSAEARIPETPAQLMERWNPCAVKPEALTAEVRKHKGNVSVFEAVSFGVVARCGASAISFSLPMEQKVDMKGLRRVHPEMTRLWDLPSRITDKAFGPKDIFHGRTEADDLILQRAGDRMVPELTAGRYDAGLRLAFHGSWGDDDPPTFRDILERYHGPVSAEAAKSNYVPRVLNAHEYKFSHFIVPTYPGVAKLARIQGTTELHLTVQPDTGEVTGVEPLAGHPLLTPAAVEAARQWRFEPNSLKSGSVKVVVDFAPRCP